MNATKQAQVNTIRANTAYPTYRSLIGIITIILMILAGLEVIGAIVGAISVGQTAGGGAGFIIFLGGLIGAVLSFFLAKIWNEGAQILVDIGDSVLDANPAGSAPPSVAPLLPSSSLTPPSY